MHFPRSVRGFVCLLSICSLLASCGSDSEIFFNNKNSSQNPLRGTYVALSDFIPSEIVLILKDNNEAAFGIASDPAPATYRIEGDTITVEVIDGSKHVFVIDQSTPNHLVHQHTQAVFSKKSS